LAVKLPISVRCLKEVSPEVRVAIAQIKVSCNEKDMNEEKALSFIKKAQ